MNETTYSETNHRFSWSVLKCFVIRFNNARKVIEQIRNGEWKPQYNSLTRGHETANRGSLQLWLGNGSFFCEITQEGKRPAFGLVWRHWVWWAAARKLKVDADKSVNTKPLVL